MDYNYEEREIAQAMLSRLPEWDIMSDRDIFYHKAWTFYLENMQLMNLYVNAKEEEVFYHILEICKEKDLPELYAVALALKKAQTTSQGVEFLT